MRFARSLALVVVVAAAGCTKKQEAPQGAPPPAAGAPTDTLRIGHVTSLAGAEATFGTSANNGVKMAVDEVNAKGGVNGKKVELLVYDDQGKPEESATAATRLETQDKVTVLIGAITSSRALAIAPISDTNQVPTVSPSATNAKVTKDGDKTRPYMFRVCFIDPFQGTVMGKFARENLKLSKAAILRDVSSDYSVGLADSFIKEFTRLGGQIVADVTYKAGDQDFKAQLTAVKAKSPEIVYLPGYYTDVALIGRQARELGLKAPMAGGDGWDSGKLYEIAQGALDGSFFTNHYTDENPSPVVQDFVKKHQQVYGSRPDAFAALGYDAARVALDALQRAATPTRTAVRDALEQTKGFQGVTGTISFDADHNPVKSAVVLGVEHNKPKYVTTVEP
ncbi:ABC transporter substrate-binding protein [Anaeromyxobacter diazotrophicus]|uniref:Ethanolamine utilization protein EutJ n=1 Tax=Anaeromyxobacter diazotrophicus TaxID=2590199 RepID=A0A7I9VJE2_9BACT|nr:ABC transporter substrate-binding protein [Anaeromyxobacter diazotrophicus]GEJ56147.1 ethanolamine utilization protein EutJ [Anaeromyxobacter diazotrophicus]